MKIGTAVPSDEELIAVKHYFIQDRSVTHPLNAGSYAAEVLNCLHELFKKNNVVVMAGGSGLYVNAVVYGMDDLPADLNLRNDLNKLELVDLLTELSIKDPEYYEIVDKENKQRVVRAIEVCRITGKSYTSLRHGGNKQHSMNVIQIALNSPRDLLYDRINKRVDIMMKSGLLDEVRSLYCYKDYPALNTVGYKELFAYLDGSSNLDFAVSMIKQNTRHYAKRQLTWLRPNTDINWFEAKDYPGLLDFVQSRLK